MIYGAYAKVRRETGKEDADNLIFIVCFFHSTFLSIKFHLVTYEKERLGGSQELGTRLFGLSHSMLSKLVGKR